MILDQQIAVLSLHRENLKATKTFEEYKNVHIAYIDMLIEQLKLNIARNEVINRWADAIAEFRKNANDNS